MLTWLAGAAACGGDDDPADPCPGGICVGNDAGGAGPGEDGGGGPGRDAGPDPAGDGGGAGCVEAWVCSPWQTDGVSDQGTRTCVDENACGTDVNRPVESAHLPALDFPFYECQVEPILDAKCSMLACHGTETGRALRVYARGRLRVTGETFTEPGCLSAGEQHPSEECIGSVECRCWTLPHTASEWRRNFDSARGFALDAAAQPLADPSTSELLAQPLVGGGYAHAGIFMWDEQSADYGTIRDWLGGATQSSCASGN